MREMLLRYHRLQAAVTRHGCAPAALAGVERRRIEALAQRSLALEDRVLDSAEAAHCTVAEVALEAALETLRGRFADSPDGFAGALAMESLDEAGLRAALTRELRFQQVMDRVGAQVALEEAEVEDYYRTHRARFQRPETREARQVLITINPDFPENRRAAARTRMEAIAARLRRQPEGFAAEATRHSECPSALEGGRLGAVCRGQLHPSLEAVLFELAVDEIGPVTESPLGWHLLRCEAIRPAAALSLAQVREPLRAQLLAQRRRQRQRQWLQGLG